MNSVGILPLSFLENSDEYKANAIFNNARALLNQFLIKANRKGETELLFQPFKPLLNYKEQIQYIRKEIKNGNFEKAEERSIKLMNLLIEGLRYYQTYDWLLLRSIVSMGYLGWIAYSSLFIFKTFSSSPSISTKKSEEKNHILLNLTGTMIYLGFCVMLYYKDSPLSYYLYTVFPIIFWTNCGKESSLIPILLHSATNSKGSTAIIHTFSYLISLELLVVSYFYRELLTVCLLIMGFVWPLFMPIGFRDRHFSIIRAWRALCFITSIFTLLPVELEENVVLM